MIEKWEFSHINWYEWGWRDEKRSSPTGPHIRFCIMSKIDKIYKIIIATEHDKSEVKVTFVSV